MKYWTESTSTPCKLHVRIRFHKTMMGIYWLQEKTLYIAESIIVFHVIFHSLDATWKFLRINYS